MGMRCRLSGRKKIVRNGQKITRLMMVMLVFLPVAHLILTEVVLGQGAQDSANQYVAVNLGSRVIKATLANTNPLRVEGLLGWSSINDDSGMLLDFIHEGSYAIHMQGMKFPIDAIWIDGSDTVRLIYENIVPDSNLTYPSMFPSRYCLEVKAGFCKRYNVRSGQKISFGTWPPKS